MTNYSTTFKGTTGLLSAVCMLVVSHTLPASSGLMDEQQFLFQEIPSVYAASKYEQKVSQAPASVTVITAEEIQRHGYRNLDDVLRSVRGFYVNNDRNYTFVGVRGFGRPGDYNTRVLLLIDGHRTHDAVYDGSSGGFDSLVNIDAVERIEVIRGTGSSLYGTNAFFAVINVITKKGRDVSGHQLSAEVGNFGARAAGYVGGGRTQSGIEWFVSLKDYSRDGSDSLYYEEFDDPATNNGLAQNVDNESFQNLSSTFIYKPFTLQAGYVKRDKTIPTASYGTQFNDPRNSTIDSKFYFDLTYQTELSARTSFTARVYHDSYYYKGKYVYDYADVGDPPDITLNHDNSDADRAGMDVQWISKVHADHKLTYGVELIRDYHVYQENFDVDEYLDDTQRNKKWALFAQDEWFINDNWLFNGGVRYDGSDNFDTEISPRVGLIYSKEKTVVKLLYGEAFRAPNAYELYYHDGGNTAKAALELNPESIKTTEIVLEQELSKQLRSVVSLYHYSISNLISLTTDVDDGLLVFKNVEKFNGRGIELELEGKTADGILGRISYAYQEAVDESNDKRIVNSPANLLKLNLSRPLVPGKVNAGMEVQYTDKRKTVYGTTAPAFAVINANVNWLQPFDNLRLGLSIYNLLDEEYNDPGSEEHSQDDIEQDGRTLRLNAVYSFK